MTTSPRAFPEKKEIGTVHTLRSHRLINDSLSTVGIIISKCLDCWPNTRLRALLAADPFLGAKCSHSIFSLRSSQSSLSTTRGGDRSRQIQHDAPHEGPNLLIRRLPHKSRRLLVRRPLRNIHFRNHRLASWPACSSRMHAAHLGMDTCIETFLQR